MATQTAENHLTQPSQSPSRAQTNKAALLATATCLVAALIIFSMLGHPGSDPGEYYAGVDGNAAWIIGL